MLLLPAVVTQHEARDVLRVFRESVARLSGGELVVDGAELQRFDSSALAVVLECRRMAQARGWRFSVRRLPDRLVELARLYGVAELFAAEDPAPAR